MSNGYYSEIFCQMDEKMVSNFHFHFFEHICIYSLAICKRFSVKCPFCYRVAYLFLINLKTLWYIRNMKPLSSNSWQLFLPVYDSSLRLFMNALYHRKFLFSYKSANHILYKSFWATCLTLEPQNSKYIHLVFMLFL